MKKYRTQILLGVALLILMWGMYNFISPESNRLGETTFYKDNNIELKVILVHENLPLHYVGNSYSVACQSKNTVSPGPNDVYELKTYHIDADWDFVPGAYLGSGLGDDNDLVLRDLVEQAKKQILVKDEMTVVVLKDTGVSVSFDGCRTFTAWNLKENIPTELIIKTTPEFELCTTEQKKNAEMNYPSYGDCEDVKFSGINVPKFESVIASDEGGLSFRVTSGAFIDGKSFTFETKDFGRTWKFLP